jgi:hypothetical protein
MRTRQWVTNAVLLLRTLPVFLRVFAQCRVDPRRGGPARLLKKTDHIRFQSHHILRAAEPRTMHSPCRRPSLWGDVAEINILVGHCPQLSHPLLGHSRRIIRIKLESNLASIFPAHIGLPSSRKEFGYPRPERCRSQSDRTRPQDPSHSIAPHHILRARQSTLPERER